MSRDSEVREALREIVDLLTTSGRDPKPLNDYGLMSTLYFYAGPDARTAVDSATAKRVTRLGEVVNTIRAILDRSSEAAPTCTDPECYGPTDPRCGAHNCTCTCHHATNREVLSQTPGEPEPGA